jgi:hypothetical protein
MLGERVSRYVVVTLLLGQYAVVGALMWTGFFGPALLACLLALPFLRQLVDIYRRPYPEAPPPELPAGVWPLWFVAAAFAYTRRFGTWFLVGLVLDLLWEPAVQLLGR